MGAVQSFRDVSERLEMDEIKRQFVSVVSHELRTPLTSIKGSLQMLDSGFMGPLSDEQQELVSMAVANSERLGQLVNDILDLERLDAGRMPLTPVEVSALTLAAGLHQRDHRRGPGSGHPPGRRATGRRRPASTWSWIRIA